MILCRNTAQPNNAARNALAAFMTGVATRSSDVGHITQPRSRVDVAPQPGDVGHITQPRSNVVVGTQPEDPVSLLLYKDTSTNPLPSDYGFIAASVAAQLQHGHVNPLSKE